MDDEVKVSVIVCTRNRVSYLQQCFSSIAAQKCSMPFEVVVIDNGSTDETQTVIRQWCEKDPRFRSAREDRLGLSQAKNAGVQLARGRLLVFTDDDVIVETNWIETYCDFFSRKRDDLVVAGGLIVPIPHDLGDWPSWFVEPALADLALLDYQAERMLTKMEWVWGGNMAIPAYMFDQFGLWDVTVGRRGDERGTFEDTEFQDRVRNAGGTVWFCPGAILHHRVDRQTITPRRVLSTAYARGRNESLRKSLLTWGNIDAAPKQNLIKCLTNLAASFILWTLWTIAFRLVGSRNCFRRAHHTAWSCGRWLGNLDAGRGSTPSYQTIARVIFLMRGLVLRLASDTPK